MGSSDQFIRSSVLRLHFHVLALASIPSSHWPEHELFFTNLGIYIGLFGRDVVGMGSKKVAWP